jgi:hypothetical protein
VAYGDAAGEDGCGCFVAVEEHHVSPLVSLITRHAYTNTPNIAAMHTVAIEQNTIVSVSDLKQVIMAALTAATVSAINISSI